MQMEQCNQERLEIKIIERYEEQANTENKIGGHRLMFNIGIGIQTW